jgi:hypothetical protein
MKPILTCLLLSLVIVSFGQKKKTYLPVWTFHQDSVNIYGLSVGLWDFAERTKHTTSDGVRIALVGEGILVAFAPSDPIPDNDSMYRAFKADTASERINGINISVTGSSGTYEINGISLGVIGHFTKRVNGISASLLNYSNQHNGIQIGVFVNECYKMRGLQIGVVNKSRKTKGVQLGLWNINEKRKLPLINWNF